MILRVSKEGMKSYENNHVVSARVSAHSGGGVPWHVHWLTPPRPPQVGDLYITFDVKFPSGGLSDSAKEGRLLRLRLHSLCISSKQCTPLSIHRCQYTAADTPAGSQPSPFLPRPPQRSARSWSSRKIPASTTVSRRSLCPLRTSPVLALLFLATTIPLTIHAVPLRYAILSFAKATRTRLPLNAL